MAFTFRDNGEVATTHILEQEALEHERQNQIKAIDRRTIEDATRWRALPERIRKKYLKLWENE